MKRILFLVLFSMTTVSLAYSNTPQVHSIVESEDFSPHIVKLTSGEVVFVEKNDPQKLLAFQKSLASSATKIGILPQHKFNFIDEGEEAPTLVDEGEIQNIFRRMNPYLKRKSECSDRAHVWAWDESQKTGIKSQKVFLLLTDTYIKKNRFKWWFHVAPLYHTSSGKKIVMDFQFFDRPVTYEEWKNSLVFSGRECVSNFRFLDYNAGADQTQDCYVKFEPMYYRIPGDIGIREQTGILRSKWNDSEVNASRSRAFFKRGL